MDKDKIEEFFKPIEGWFVGAEDLHGPFDSEDEALRHRPDEEEYEDYEEGEPHCFEVCEGRLTVSRLSEYEKLFGGLLEDLLYDEADRYSHPQADYGYYADKLNLFRAQKDSFIAAMKAAVDKWQVDNNLKTERPDSLYYWNVKTYEASLTNETCTPVSKR